MKARISQLHRTEKGWEKLSNWVPEAGEVVVYDPDEAIKFARINIGDGISSLNTLPFCLQSAIETELKKHNYSKVLDGGNITDYL